MTKGRVIGNTNVFEKTMKSWCYWSPHNMQIRGEERTTRMTENWEPCKERSTQIDFLLGLKNDCKVELFMHEMAKLDNVIT